MHDREMWWVRLSHCRFTIPICLWRAVKEVINNVQKLSWHSQPLRVLQFILPLVDSEHEWTVPRCLRSQWLIQQKYAVSGNTHLHSTSTGCKRDMRLPPLRVTCSLMPECQPIVWATPWEVCKSDMISKFDRRVGESSNSICIPMIDVRAGHSQPLAVY